MTGLACHGRNILQNLIRRSIANAPDENISERGRILVASGNSASPCESSRGLRFLQIASAEEKLMSLLGEENAKRTPHVSRTYDSDLHGRPYLSCGHLTIFHPRSY